MNKRVIPAIKKRTKKLATVGLNSPQLQRVKLNTLKDKVVESCEKL